MKAFITITPQGDKISSEVTDEQYAQAQKRHDSLASSGKYSDDVILSLSPKPSSEALAQGLLKYTANVRWKKVLEGVNVNGIDIPTDDQTQKGLAGAVTLAQLNPSIKIEWKLKDGSFITVSSSEIIEIGKAVATYIQNCFSAESDLVSSINSSSPITVTRAQIDEKFAVIAGR
jgi:hypothetical protein